MTIWPRSRSSKDGEVRNWRAVDPKQDSLREVGKAVREKKGFRQGHKPGHVRCAVSYFSKVPMSIRYSSLTYTNNGNLIGNTVGRMGRSIQYWFNYWISPRNTMQFTYKHNTVSQDFVPQGGAWQDYGLRHEIELRSGVYVKSQLQYEHISRYPLLFSHPQSNITAVVELGFVPHKLK